MALSQRILRLVPVMVVASLAMWAASRNNDDFCGNVGECLGLSFDDLVTLVVAVPVGALLLRTLRVPRVLLHTSLALVAAAMLWYAGGEILRTIDPDRPHEALLPWPLAVAAGALGGAAAAYVAGPDGRRPLRLAVAGLIVAVTAGAASVADLASRADRATELEATGITLYAPVVAGNSPSYASASDDRVRLNYLLELDEGTTAYLSVDLLRTPAGSLCSELVVMSPECVEDGDTMRSIDDSTVGYVALVRGDTTLLGEFDATKLDVDELLQALREAPDVDAADLTS